MSAILNNRILFFGAVGYRIIIIYILLCGGFFLRLIFHFVPAFKLEFMNYSCKQKDTINYHHANHIRCKEKKLNKGKPATWQHALTFDFLSPSAAPIAEKKVFAVPFVYAAKCFMMTMLFLGWHYTHAQNFTESNAFKRANNHWIGGFAENGAYSSVDIRWDASPTTVTAPVSSLATCYSYCSSAVSDTGTGQLLFFSTPTHCLNRNYLVMPNGANLSGSSGGGGQVVSGIGHNPPCIVPVIDSPGKYYVFVIGAHQLGSVPAPLYYSVVDMSLDGGLGDLVSGQTNIMLDAGPLHESMVAVPGNNCDIWLVVHDYYTSTFKSYHISKAGIDPTPVLSVAGPTLPPGNWPAYEYGGLAISPDRSMIAMSTSSFAACTNLGLILPSSGVVVARFHPDDGTVNNLLILNDTISCDGISFSKDNSKLYVQASDAKADMLTTGILGNSQVLQFDVSVYNQAAMLASRQIVYDAPFSTPTQTFSLRKHEDTITTQYAFHISDTTVPKFFAQSNLSGSASDLRYTPVVAGVPGGIESAGHMGLDVVYPFPPDTTFFQVPDTAICMGDSIVLSGVPGFTHYHWDNQANTITRTISDSGVYWVLNGDPCHSRVDTFRIRFRKDPTVALGADTVICFAPPFELVAIKNNPAAQLLWSTGSTEDRIPVPADGLYWIVSTIDGCSASDTVSITFRDIHQDFGPDINVCRGEKVNVRLSARGNSQASLLWSTGSTASSIVVTDTGSYWLQASYPPCASSDTVRVQFEQCSCLVAAPSAFSPNNDGLNDIFYPVIEPGCPIKGYVLSIFNRWGQRVYSGYSPQEGWDGIYNGTAADAGTYFYEYRFYGGTKSVAVQGKGDVLLVR